MKYNELNITKSQPRKRVGRGISAGQGKTAGRGTKGQNSRSGNSLRLTFQGGQLPLVQAVPKARGFKSSRTPAQIVYLDTLNSFEGSVADNHSLSAAGYVATPYHTIKVIGRGELTRKISLRVQGASKSVQAAITKQGGTFEKTPVPIRTSTKKTKESAE